MFGPVLVTWTLTAIQIRNWNHFGSFSAEFERNSGTASWRQSPSKKPSSLKPFEFPRLSSFPFFSYGHQAETSQFWGSGLYSLHFLGFCPLSRIYQCSCNSIETDRVSFSQISVRLVDSKQINLIYNAKFPNQLGHNAWKQRRKKLR